MMQAIREYLETLATRVGEGWNRVQVNNDPTAHGEVEAIRDAARRLQSPTPGVILQISSPGLASGPSTVVLTRNEWTLLGWHDDTTRTTPTASIGAITRRPATLLPFAETRDPLLRTRENATTTVSRSAP